DRVPGVVPALTTDDQVGGTGQEIGGFPLALVAPLGSDQDRYRHESDSIRRSFTKALPGYQEDLTALSCPAGTFENTQRTRPPTPGRWPRPTGSRWNFGRSELQSTA